MSKELNKKITELTLSEDQKAEMTLITILHGRERTEKRRFCSELGCEWEEYKRLLRKYRHIIERWKAEGGETDEDCK